MNPKNNRKKSQVRETSNNQTTYTIVDFFKQLLEIDINDESQTHQLLYDFVMYFLTNDLDTIISDLEMLQQVLLSYKSSILFSSMYRTQINMYLDDLDYIISYFKILNQSYKQLLFQQSVKQTKKPTTENKKSRQIDTYIIERIKFDMLMSNLINIITEQDEETESTEDDTTNEPELVEEPGGITIDVSPTDDTNTQQNKPDTDNIDIGDLSFNPDFGSDEESDTQSDTGIKPVDIDEDVLNKMLKSSVFYDLYLTQLNFDFKHISELFNILINMVRMFVNINNVNIKKISL